MAGEIGHYCGIDFIGGGIGAVDKIDGSVLQDKDAFLVVTSSVFAPLSLDADSGAGESSPQIIAPNTNPGDKRWILTGGVFAGLTLYDNIVMPDGGTIGIADGPLLTFDDTGKDLEVDGCELHVNLSNDTVYAPATLHSPISIFENLSKTNGAGGFIRLVARNANDYMALANLGVLSEATNSKSTFVIQMRNGDSYVERFRIDSAGKVGIDTDTPLAKLVVSGNSDVSFADCELRIVDNDESAGSLVPSIAFYAISTRLWTIRGTDNEGLQFRNSADAIKIKCLDSGGIHLLEQAAASSDSANYGQIWVKSATPNELWFTDDTGVDHQIAYVV